MLNRLLHFLLPLSPSFSCHARGAVSMNHIAPCNIMWYFHLCSLSLFPCVFLSVFLSVSLSFVSLLCALLRSYMQFVLVSFNFNSYAYISMSMNILFLVWSFAQLSTFDLISRLRLSSFFAVRCPIKISLRCFHHFYE